jgi:hypothetical protein
MTRGWHTHVSSSVGCESVEREEKKVEMQTTSRWFGGWSEKERVQMVGVVCMAGMAMSSFSSYFWKRDKDTLI